jgi:hypothetical protein
VQHLVSVFKPDMLLFHYVDSLVSHLGLQVAETLAVDHPMEILFCDNLGRMVKSNSMRLLPKCKAQKVFTAGLTE